jgi:hypothetical protein
MREYKTLFSALLLTGVLSPLSSYGQAVEAKPDIRAFASSPQWLTTKVYIEGAPEVDVKEKYPGVVGISMWDTERSRYEFFYTDTGKSKYDNGGGGYFLVSGDTRTHVLVPDKGTARTVVRRLEKLNNEEFTYSREVPRDMAETNAPVRIYVVHAPYAGPIKTSMSN